VSSRPSAELRRLVIERAGNHCEYCQIHQDDVIATHQIDHVIAEKHGGGTTPENLALSCMLCNLRKGSDLSSVDPASSVVVPLFNPRTHDWSEPFRLDGLTILGLTPEGRTTVEFLQLNSYERLAERQELVQAGRFPQ
jgi:hypothetical protein